MKPSILALFAFLLFHSSLLQSSKTESEKLSKPDTVVSPSSGRILLLVKRGESSELLECVSRSGLSTQCKTLIKEIQDPEIEAVRLSLDAQLQDLKAEPSMLNYFMTVFETPAENGETCSS